MAGWVGGRQWRLAWLNRGLAARYDDTSLHESFADSPPFGSNPPPRDLWLRSAVSSDLPSAVEKLFVQRCHPRRFLSRGTARWFARDTPGRFGEDRRAGSH